ncbi:MAG: response regulator [Candidatus Marinimicrobia bacterium]|nr:response regulator [Candidatus Neomarinimicrobiota bacterium]
MGSKGHILVVDDDRMNILQIEKLFMEQGYKVSSVDSGEGALEFLEKEIPDIILLDVILDRLDGYETCTEIRKKIGSKIPVIFTTDEKKENDIVKCYAAGGDDYVRKPIIKEELLARVKILLDKQNFLKEIQLLNENLEYLVENKTKEINILYEISKMASHQTSIDTFCRNLIKILDKYFSSKKNTACIQFEQKIYKTADFKEEYSIFSKELKISNSQKLVFCTGVADREKNDIESMINFSEILANEIAQIIEHFEIQSKADEYMVFLTAMLNGSPDGIVVLDEKGNFIQLNPAFREMFGMNDQQVTGKNIKTLFDPFNLNGTGINIFEEINLKGKYYFELTNLKVSDHKLNLSITGASLSKDIQVNGYLLICKNINQRIEMETQMQSLSKMESIGRLAAGIAHEINSPIQFIRNNADFISDSMKSILHFTKKINLLVDDDQIKLDEKREVIKTDIEELDLEFINDEMQNAISESIEGINRITKIINAMRTFSHPGTDQKKNEYLNEIIDNAVIVSKNEWKYDAKIEVDFKLEHPVPVFRDKISQVILNLIINAAHAIHDMKREELGKIKISTDEVEGFAEIRVADNGIGIPEEIRNRIYEPFFTTKEIGKGTGQGLSVIYNIVVKNHHGTIDCVTEVGKGTTFILRLPMYAMENEENNV